MIDAARRAGPRCHSSRYGFSPRTRFRDAAVEAGLSFIGPSPQRSHMGQTAARERRCGGVPIGLGTESPLAPMYPTGGRGIAERIGIRCSSRRCRGGARNGTVMGSRSRGAIHAARSAAGARGTPMCIWSGASRGRGTGSAVLAISRHRLPLVETECSIPTEIRKWSRSASLAHSGDWYADERGGGGSQSAGTRTKHDSVNAGRNGRFTSWREHGLQVRIRPEMGRIDPCAADPGAEVSA